MEGNTISFCLGQFILDYQNVCRSQNRITASGTKLRPRNFAPGPNLDAWFCLKPQNGVLTFIFKRNIFLPDFPLAQFLNVKLWTKISLSVLFKFLPKFQFVLWSFNRQLWVRDPHSKNMHFSSIFSSYSATLSSRYLIIATFDDSVRPQHLIPINRGNKLQIFDLLCHFL